MDFQNFKTKPTYSPEDVEVPSRPKISKRKISETDFNFLNISSPLTHSAINRLRAQDIFEQRNIQDRLPCSLQPAGTDMMDLDRAGNSAPEALPLEPRFAIVVSGYNQAVNSEELVSVTLIS